MKVDDLSDAQIAAAGNLAGRRLLSVGLERAGWSADRIDAKLDEIIAAAIGHSNIGKAEQRAVTGALRKLYPALEENGGELADVADHALDIARRAGDAQSAGTEASLIIISVAFSIALLVIVSQVGVRGKVGSFEIEKAPGFPPEIVKVVESISKVAAAALGGDKEAGGQNGDGAK